MKLIFIMAFILQCDITIGAYRFRQVNEVRIEKSWREIGDRCILKLPKHVSTDKLTTSTLENFIKPGDAVTVVLWYSNGKMDLDKHVEFQGYVRRMMPNIPFELECEDAVYLFKRTNINKTFRNTTLAEIVSHIVKSVNDQFDAGITVYPDIPKVDFDQFRIPNMNAADVLQLLKEDGLTSYFKNKELFVGLAYQQRPGTVKYSLAWNIIESDLEERLAEDTQLRVRMTGIKRDNTRVEVIVGDDKGEQRDFYSHQITDEAQLKQLANEHLQKLKYSGWDGTITTFLYPYAEPLMTAVMQDPQYGERRAGSFVIDSVITTFSTSGARREVELGAKISE